MPDQFRHARIPVFFLTLLLFLFSFSHSALAVFQLTATPNDGGFDLRFGRISGSDFKVTKEMTIRVSSDIGRQYRVLHRVIQPLSTPSGVTIPDDQFRMYPRINSNSQGTLLYSDEVPVSHFDTTLYSSNGTGSGDSFQLVYTLTPKPDQAPGSYYGRIAYILIPVDSTESQVVVNLNIYVELAGGPVASVEIKTQTGQRRLVIKSEQLKAGREVAFLNFPSVSFSVHGPLGTRYRIYQKFEGEGVASSAGDDFDLTQVMVFVDGARQGVAATPASLKGAALKQLLYTSDDKGSPEDFTVTYKSEKNFRLQKPGLYKGRLVYSLETEGAQGIEPKTLDTYDVEFDIAPLFDVYVYSGGQEGVSLKFGEVSFKTGPKTSDVDVYIESNLGQHYQLIQKVYSPMINEQGDKVPEKDFTVKALAVEDEETPKLVLDKETPVREGETVVFDSGPQGFGAHVKLQYKLVMRPDSRGGRYGAQLGYSLVQN